MCLVAACAYRHVHVSSMMDAKYTMAPYGEAVPAPQRICQVAHHLGGVVSHPPSLIVAAAS